ncbi:MAG: radical SAM protein [Candidatus Methanomethylicia archaeon]|nr:radical SAM protein [Candidatus Methanomethylicia archaeon]MCQ5341005.1 radical SAM protein [Candidatus Methanomethylicia archaeon]
MNYIELAFGPIPSRRLGRSLGVNNIPPKSCSYSCIYCQLGKTNNVIIDRQEFYKPEQIFAQVEKRINNAILKGEKIDCITFVPYGEPTLDTNLGKEISLLKEFGFPIAVITNASLLWNEEIREELLTANFISLKIDAINSSLWRYINRPHKDLKLDRILDGIKEFTKNFKGIIVSETMLINDINYENELEEIANFLKDLTRLDKAYIAIPIRPPAEKWVRPAKEDILNKAFQIFSEKLGSNKVEFLIEYEKNNFAFTGNIKEDLLSITNVHPMREEAIATLLKKANASWQVVEDLLSSGELIRIEYEGNICYMRKFLTSPPP